MTFSLMAHKQYASTLCCCRPQTQQHPDFITVAISPFPTENHVFFQHYYHSALTGLLCTCTSLECAPHSSHKNLIKAEVRPRHPSQHFKCCQHHSDLNPSPLKRPPQPLIFPHTFPILVSYPSCLCYKSRQR